MPAPPLPFGLISPARRSSQACRLRVMTSRRRPFGRSASADVPAGKTHRLDPASDPAGPLRTSGRSPVRAAARPAFRWMILPLWSAWERLGVHGPVEGLLNADVVIVGAGSA